jgi:hypothetical protein
MFLSRPSFSDDSVAAGIAISNASMAPGATSPCSVGATPAASRSWTRRAVVVEAVYS